MKNPEYKLGMTYEDYSAWYATLDEGQNLFGPPGCPNVWLNPDGIREHIQRLKSHQPCNSLGHIALVTDIKIAEERLEYLLHLAEKGKTL